MMQKARKVKDCYRILGVPAFLASSILDTVCGRRFHEGEQAAGRTIAFTDCYLLSAACYLSCMAGLSLEA